MPNPLVGLIKGGMLDGYAQETVTSPASGWDNLDLASAFSSCIVDDHFELLVDACHQDFAQGITLSIESGVSYGYDEIKVCL